MVRRALDAARDLLLGEVCACCGAAGDGLVCRRCRALLQPQPYVVHPLVAPRGFPVTTAACAYAGAVRRLLVVHKEQGRLAAVAPLGWLLAEAVSAALPGSDPLLLVPVPSRRAIVRRRGHDPVARMARAAARELAGRRSVVVAAALRHTRTVADQSGLDRHGRWSNLEGALSVRAGVPAAAAGSHVVVVDDICSSGATLSAAAAALACWALPVRAAVVAAPPPRTGRLAVTSRLARD